MSCPSRLDPAVHLPPGIFHSKHIAGDQSLRNKCCTFPPLDATIPEMAKKDELQAKETIRTLILCQFTVLFLCAPERTHPSIHPAPFHSAGIPFLPRKVTHDLFSKIPVWEEKNRKHRLMRWSSCGIRPTPGDALQLRNSHSQVASLRSPSLQGTSVKL